MPVDTRNKLSMLEAVFQEMGSVITAFSGGVDSTLVAVAAHRVLGERALAVTAVSPALAARELDDATGLAASRGFAHRVINTNEMDREGYTANSPRRCYFCKTELYSQLTALADAEGYSWVANGANTDDRGDYRPGMQAAAEHRVRSPLIEAGLDKQDVRQIARELDIPVWNKPAQPCLSSRVPYGTPVTAETLSKIEQAEDYLRGLGLRGVRARHHDRLCRIEVDEDELEVAFRRRKEIVAQLKKIGYLWVSLDLAGLRSGSLNDQLNLTTLESGGTGPLGLGPPQLRTAMRVAYIQSIGGASGDMVLGALVDLGVPLPLLCEELGRLEACGFRITAQEETRCEIRGTHLKVHLDDSARFSPQELLKTVTTSKLPPQVVECSTRVLNALWQAECRVHGVGRDSIELEELGSVDTLVDVVGTSIALHHLGVEEVYAAPLVLGAPSLPRRAGGYSNPAPATLELIAAAKAPVAADNPIHQGAGELTTPTGAALLTALAEFSRPAFNVHAVGVGLGTRDPEAFPNALRVWLGETSEASAPEIFQEGRVVLLETNLDDAPGVVLGYAQEKLFELGALDVWYTPAQMKKNRPGAVLSVLVPKELEQAAFETILRETPTLGIRTRTVDRYVAERYNTSVQTEFGPVQVKVKSLEGQPVSAAPEPDDCRRIAKETGAPFQTIYQRVAEAARRQILP